MVIPSLLQGGPIAAFKSNRRRRAALRNLQRRRRWQHFDPHATLFAAAQSLGWGTGVAGWYNPYCRILAAVLDRCYWTYHDFAGGLGSAAFQRTGRSAECARRLCRSYRRLKTRLSTQIPPNSHKRDYHRSSRMRSEALIRRYGHPLCVYPFACATSAGHLSRSRSAAAGLDYLGNLILADQTLAQLRAVIAKTACCRGHDSHRLLRSFLACAALAQTCRAGPRPRSAPPMGASSIPRPVLMVHFPGQTQPDAESINRPRKRDDRARSAAGSVCRQGAHA